MGSAQPVRERGYHEVFRLFVLAVVVAHFSAVAFFALPHS
jgi:hypothetical protein